MRLFLLELKKTVIKRGVLIVVALLAAANIYNIYDNYKTYESKNPTMKGYDKVYSRVRDIMTLEKIDFVVQEYLRLEEIVQSSQYSTEYNPKTYTEYTFGVRALFVNKQYVFISVANSNSVYKIDRKFRTVTEIINDLYSNLAFDGANIIYYLDRLYQIKKYDTLSSETTVYEGIKSEKFYYFDGYIYFDNLFDGRKLYRIPAAGGEKQKISDSWLFDYFCAGKDVYYINTAGKSLSKISLADLSRQKLTDTEASSLYGFEGYDKLILTKYDSIARTTREFYYDKTTGVLSEKQD